MSVDRLVLDSVETPDRDRCVDIFRRGDEIAKRMLNTPPKPRKKQPKRPNGQKK